MGANKNMERLHFYPKPEVNPNNNSFFLHGTAKNHYASTGNVALLENSR